MSIETLFQVASSSFARATIGGAATRLAAGITLASLTACGVFGSDPPAAATAAPASGSTDVAPPPSNATPADNATPPPVGGPASDMGLFVSSSRGADDGTGTATHPLKSLKAAFAIAQAKNLQVVVCAEEYAENVEVINGVSAYGNYDCSKMPWVSSATLKAIVRAPNSPAVIAKNITLPTHLDGFELRSPDLGQIMASDDTASSIALEVHDSTALIVSNSLVHAGTGAAGTDGTDGAANTLTGTSGLPAQNQNTRTCVLGPLACLGQTVPGTAGGTTACAIGPAGGAGGQGGPGQWYSSPGVFPQGWTGHGLPQAATATTASGGAVVFRAQPGAAGAAGADGTDGTNGAWAISASGFVRGNGSAGGAGSPGQGGGGGAGIQDWYDAAGAFTSNPTNSTYVATATGAGGGAGGCAGQPGAPATGGGASIGALVMQSTVTFDHLVIETSAGGAAGKGNLGTPGTDGSVGGAGIYVTANSGGVVTEVSVTGSGGNGGAGGGGGASGHGAAGPSIAIAFSKTAPTMTEVTLTPGAGGAGQPALMQGASSLPAVADGESLQTYEIKP
jgi:hypothetical protein